MIPYGKPTHCTILHGNDTTVDALEEKAKAKVGAEKKSQSIEWFTNYPVCKKATKPDNDLTIMLPDGSKRYLTAELCCFSPRHWDFWLLL